MKKEVMIEIEIPDGTRKINQIILVVNISFIKYPIVVYDKDLKKRTKEI